MASDEHQVEGSITPELGLYLEGGAMALEPAQFSDNSNHAAVIEIGYGTLSLFARHHLEVELEPAPPRGVERISPWQLIGTIDEDEVKAQLAVHTSHVYEHGFGFDGRVTTTPSRPHLRAAILGIRAKVTVDCEGQDDFEISASASIIYNGSDTIPRLDMYRGDVSHRAYFQETRLRFIREVAASVGQSLLQSSTD